MLSKRKTVSLLVGGLVAAIGIAAAAPADQKPLQPIPHAPAPATVPAHAGRLGVAALEISTELREHFGAPGDRGVLVDGVQSDSPAARAGVHVGDVVVELGKQPTSSARAMRQMLRGRNAGDVVDVTVIRDGKRLELHAKLDAAPAEHADAPGGLGDGFPDLGDDGDMQQFMDHAREMLRQMQQPQQPQQRQQHLPGDLSGGPRA